MSRALVLSRAQDLGVRVRASEGLRGVVETSGEIIIDLTPNDL